MTILTSISRRMHTLLLPSDRKSGTCHWMVPMWMLYIMTLTYSLKATHFEMWISRKLVNVSSSVYDFYRNRYFAIEWNHCEWCTPWPWPSFSRSNIFLLCNCYKKIARAPDVPGKFASTHNVPATKLLLFFLCYLSPPNYFQDHKWPQLFLGIK